MDYSQSYTKFQEDVLSSDEPSFGEVFKGKKISSGGVFSDPSRDISVRTGYNRKVYEHYRPGERIPDGRTQMELQQIMAEANRIYERVGVIKSTFDMMSEFAAEGIEIVAPDEEPHKFYQSWSRMINLRDRAERLSSWALRSGNVVIRRKFGKLDPDKIRRMRRSNSNYVSESVIPPDKFGYIPLGYIFYNPANVEVLGGEIMALSDKKIYGLKLTHYGLQQLTKYPELIKTLPEEIQNKLQNKKNPHGIVIELPKDKIFVGHMKKDDTDLWAKPILYSIFSDVYYNDKVKMAKTVTLDNMISTIRLWKLGDHKEQILPTKAAGSKLNTILSQNTGGGPIDIIWDSAISFEEHFPPIEKLADFSEDYNSILLGLGVPDTLIGGESKGKGSLSMTTLGLKNMIKRIEACRRLIVDWLNGEIDIIQKNMGFKRRPEIRFSHADLYDDRTYFNLLLQLVDRNIVPDDRILEIIGEIPEFERFRIQQQEIDRDKGDRPPKAGPYNNPQLDDIQDHEVKKLKINANNAAKKVSKDSDDGGRPDGSKDTVKRTRGPNRKRSLGAFMIESSRIYDFVDEIVNKIMLNEWGHNDLRKLTSAQRNKLDDIKMSIFPRITPFSNVTENNILDYIQNNNAPLHAYKAYYEENMAHMGNMNDKKICRVGAYAQSWFEMSDKDE